MLRQSKQWNTFGFGWWEYQSFGQWGLGDLIGLGGVGVEFS